MRGLALLAITVAACSPPEPAHEPLTPTDARPDAFELTSCWPEDVTPVARGSVSLGTGEDAFVAIGTDVALVYGSSGGYYVPLNVRMTGLAPGSSGNLFDPHNPRTRLRAFFADTGRPLMSQPLCFRGRYAAGSGGYHELEGGASVLADVCWHSGDLIGQRVRLELEVIDAFGGYATDVRTVILAAPPAGSYPIVEGPPGCEAP